MPFMQTQVERVDLTERKEEHKEDQPRQQRSERRKEIVPEPTDQHRYPKGIRIKQASNLIYHLTIYQLSRPLSQTLPPLFPHEEELYAFV